MAEQGRILVVAEAAALEGLSNALTQLDYVVCAAESSGLAALAAVDDAKVDDAKPELALIDLAVEGAADTAYFLSIDRGVSLVYLVDAADAASLRRPQAAAPLGYVLKPFDPAQLELTLHAALATRRRLAKPESQSRFPPGRLLQTIFQSVNEGVAVVDANGQLRFANPAAARMVGMELADTVDPQLANFKLMRVDRTERLPWEEVPPMRAIRFGESSRNVEGFLEPPTDVEGLFVSMDAQPLHDDKGRRSGCLVVFRNIDEQKAAEAELRETAARLAEQTNTMDAVFDGIADGVAVMDTKGKVLRVNKPALDIVTAELVRDVPAITPQTGLGVFYSDRVTPVPPDELPHMRALRGEPVDQMRVFLVHPTMPDGVFLDVSARVVRVTEGEPVRVVIMFRDVTVEHQQEQALLQAFAQGRLEVIDTVLHNIGNAANSVTTGVGTLRERLRSRKLRSRLAAVTGALQAHGDDWLAYLRDDPQGPQVVPFLLALDKDWTQENAELLAIAERVTERVDRIAEILRTQQSLDMASAERKTVRVERAIRAGVRILEESLMTRGVAVRVDCSGAPAEIALQEGRFHQMLVHVLRNAIEAIDARRAAGGPSFSATVGVATRVEADHWFVDVTDNGIGIAPEYLDRVFTPGFTTKDEGSGLGLHSAANYVIGSGGRIEALSNGRNQGATIRSWWPLRAVLPG